MSGVIGVIPARYGSVRFPGKVLTPIYGKPLIQWVVERASLAGELDQVLVATDDDRVVEALRRVPVEVIKTRPDHPSGTDRIAEAVAGRDLDAVINIQGDEPMMDPGLIDRLVQGMRSGAFDMATAATPIRSREEREDPGVVKVVLNAADEALYFSRSVIPYVRDEDESNEPVFYRHLGIYAYRMDFLTRLVQEPVSALERAEKLEQLRALHMGARIHVVVTEDQGVGVDHPADVEKIEQAMVLAGLVQES